MSIWTTRSAVTATVAITSAVSLPAVSLPAAAARPASADVTAAHVTAAHVTATRGKAVNLRLNEKTRRLLADAFWEQYYGEHHPGTRSRVDGPKTVYYGKIRGATPAEDVFWAAGFIGVKGDPVSYQDGPHIWRKRGHHGWKYRGDTGGCVDEIPAALLKVWQLRKVWHLPKCG
ncbi:hypothetical protein [Microbispora rosea]|uniref:hypothetical protein n=1 Tax=Microbispora rosea TaxID=58117 RepID=UPI0034265D65